MHMKKIFKKIFCLVLSVMIFSSFNLGAISLEDTTDAHNYMFSVYCAVRDEISDEMISMEIMEYVAPDIPKGSLVGADSEYVIMMETFNGCDVDYYTTFTIYVVPRNKTYYGKQYAVDLNVLDLELNNTYTTKEIELTFRYISMGLSNGDFGTASQSSMYYRPDVNATYAWLLNDTEPLFNEINSITGYAFLFYGDPPINECPGGGEHDWSSLGQPGNGMPESECPSCHNVGWMWQQWFECTKCGDYSEIQHCGYCGWQG